MSLDVILKSHGSRCEYSAWLADGTQLTQRHQFPPTMRAAALALKARGIPFNRLNFRLEDGRFLKSASAVDLLQEAKPAPFRKPTLPVSSQAHFGLYLTNGQRR